MPISDLFGLLQKRQTTPDKYLASSVNIVSGGQHGAQRAPFSPYSGVRAFRSWVYAAASINANAVAALPLRLYAKKDATPLPTRSIPRGRKAYMMGDLSGDARPSASVMRKAVAYGDDFEEVTGSHPITDLLARANPFLNGFDLSVLRILYGELTGNAYLHPIIDEASGLPAEIWPLAPHYVEVIPDDDEFIRGYVYGVDSQHKQIFEPDEVIHFRRPNPGNYFYGLGKVEAAWGVIQANEAVHEMDLATFANQARPDYAVVVKGNPTGDQLDRFQQQVENKLRGTRKNGSFLAMSGDVQFTPLNFPPKDLAGREEIVEEIAAVFGVPVSMLKANDPNLASAQTGFAQWREGTILPLCRMDEEELNQSLLPMFGLEDTHCLAYDNPVPADKAYELQERQTAVAGGWRTPNEARIEEGREPIDDEFADRLLVGGQPIGDRLLRDQDAPAGRLQPSHRRADRRGGGKGNRRGTCGEAGQDSPYAR
jgi:HK97 family phage portal protein